MKLHLVLPILIVLLLLFPTPPKAQAMQNDRFILDLQESEEVLPTSKPLVTPEKALPSPPKEKKPESFFPKMDSVLDLSLTLSTEKADFGILSPTSPTERQLSITLTGTTNEVFLYTFENHPLESQNNTIIPDTTCDNGSCSQIVASTWESTLSFGLGYSCKGNVCDEDFEETRFRPFTTSLTPFAKTKLGIGRKQMLILPLKLNIPGTQTSGDYSNRVTLLAVPSL